MALIVNVPHSARTNPPMPISVHMRNARTTLHWVFFVTNCQVMLTRAKHNKVHRVVGVSLPSQLQVATSSRAKDQHNRLICCPPTICTGAYGFPVFSFRSISLSFLSPFHLSFTVLVRYRSRNQYLVFEENYLRLTLESQPARLLENGTHAAGGCASLRDYQPAVVLAFQHNYVARPCRDTISTNYNSDRPKTARF